MSNRGAERALRGRLRAAAFCLSLAVLAVAWGPAQSAVSNDPPFIPPVSREPPKGTRVNVVASTLTYDGRTKIARATGSVQLTYGPYTLTATEVVYDMRKGTFRANGSVVLREPNGNVLQASMAELNDTFKEGFARHVRALLTNDVTITADYARRLDSGITVYEHVSYTACKACVDANRRPLWQILSPEVTHDQNTQTLYYRDASLEIGGVPVFWTPYLEYPDPTVKRRTGFLLPSFSAGDAYGVGVTTPFFWALAPNADLTFRPRWTTWQGPLADVEWRHRLTNGIYNIRGYGIHELSPGRTSDSHATRAAVQTQGDFRLDRTWTWGWDATVTRDHTFLDDYDIDNSTMITSSAHLTGLSGRNYASAQALRYQTMLDEKDFTRPDPTRPVPRPLEQTEIEQYGQSAIPAVAPYINTSYYFDQPVFGGELGLDMSAYSLHRRDEVDITNDFGLGTSQTRAVAKLNWQRQFIGGMGTVITPFTQLRSDLFITENVPGAPQATDTSGHLLPMAGIDMRLPLIAATDTSQSVLTPVFQIVAARDERDETSIGNEDALTLNFDHSNLFLTDRFSGFDRYEGGTRANAGFVYNLLGENGGFLRASFGESFHIAGNNSFAAGSGLDGPSSDLVGAVAFQPDDAMRFTYEARLEEDLSRVNVQEASASLTFDRISGSLSYADIASAAAYGREGHEQQIWGDASYGFSEAWSLFGGFRFDIEGNDFMNKNIGVAFDCDCMSAKLTYAETRNVEKEIDRSLRFSVELRTIGAVNGGFSF